MSGYEYTVALDRFYLGVTALVSTPLQATFFTSAVAFNEPAVLLPGTAVTCIALSQLVFWLGAGAGLSIRNILVVGLLGLQALHLFIFSIVRTRKSRQRNALAAQNRPVRPPLGVTVSYILFPWVFFLPFIISCSPPVSYSGEAGQNLRFEPFPSDVIGLVIMAIAFLVEIAAWYGKLRFDLRSHRNLGDGTSGPAATNVLSHGIYAITRNPLLFAIPLLSFGMWLLVTTPAFYAWDKRTSGMRFESPGREALLASVVAPFVISVVADLVLLPWLELTQETHYRSLASQRAYTSAEGDIWTAYEVYRSRTSPIVPFPPSLYRGLPTSVKRRVFSDRSLDASAGRRLGTHEAAMAM